MPGFVGSGASITNLPLSGLAQSGATADQVATWNGSAWAPADATGGGAGGFPVPMEKWYDMETQDPTPAPHRAWSDGSGNTVYARALGETNTWNLPIFYRVATGAAIRVRSPLAWETGTNQTATVVCDIYSGYTDTLVESVTNTTGTLGTLADIATSDETILGPWTNAGATRVLRFDFDKANSVEAYGELGFAGQPTVDITE